ncbi:MAG TPA: hypothetical protein PK808_04660, partial [Polymorphobacter sp.]|nr:hypothetical protein [Polymorphobacter sp.]
MLECRIFLKRRAGVLAPALALLLTAPAVAQQTDPVVQPLAPPTPRPTAAAMASETDLFQVDQRNPVNNPTGAFFNGLPLPNLGYSVSASLLSTYDSNYRRLPDNKQPALGQSRSSFRFTPTINGRVNLPVGRQSLFATASIGKDFYTANSAYDRQRLMFSGGVNLAAGSSCTGSLNGSWMQAQSNPNATIGSQVLPNTQTTTSFGASASCGGISGFTPT